MISERAMEIMSEGMHGQKAETFSSDYKGDSVVIRLFRTISCTCPEQSAEEWLQRVREACYSMTGELKTQIAVFPALGGEDGCNNAAAVVGGYDIFAYGEPDEEDPEQAESADIRRIAELCMQTLLLDSECFICAEREHDIPEGIRGMFNTLGWAITGEESHRMVKDALPMFGYLMGSGEAGQTAERMKETHPEVAELIHAIRKFAPGAEDA